jgi:hypothetical protein
MKGREKIIAATEVERRGAQRVEPEGSGQRKAASSERRRGEKREACSEKLFARGAREGRVSRQEPGSPRKRDASSQTEGDRWQDITEGCLPQGGESREEGEVGLRGTKNRKCGRGGGDDGKHGRSAINKERWCGWLKGKDEGGR